MILLLNRLGKKIIQISYYIKRKEDERIDAKYNIQTIMREGDCDLVNKTYVPCPNSLLKKMFSSLPLEANDYFFDFGCGKGRAILWASQENIKFVGGVERDKEVYYVLANNINSLKKRFIDARYYIYNMDVRDLELDDRITYAFFYDPFPYYVFYGVCKKLIESYKRNKRKMYLLYCNEKADIRSCIESFGELEMVDEIVDETIECSKCYSIKVYKIGDR